MTDNKLRELYQVADLVSGFHKDMDGSMCYDMELYLNKYDDYIVRMRKMFFLSVGYDYSRLGTLPLA